MAKKKKNIDFMIQMIQSFINGDIGMIDFYLDFQYELELRYQKMLKEDDFITDQIYYLIMDKCISRYYETSDQDFKQAVEEAYEEINNLYYRNYDIL